MPGKVLIADDEPNILLTLEYLMKREGYEVLLAHDGQEALDIMLADTPDLVLLDVMMPRKNGFDVCQEMRSSDSLRDVPILMLSAKGRETDVAKGLALGANDYVIKPFSTQDLAAKVRTMLGEK